MSADTERIARRIREAAGSVDAPARLHARVAEEVARSAPARRRRVLAAGGALAGALAAAVVAVVLVLGSGGAGPRIERAAALALRPPATSAPAVDPSDPAHLRAEVGGVRFPNYRSWRPVGSRTDELDGRRAVTVAYSASGATVGYTIVDGAPLKLPKDVTWHEYSGYRVAVLRDDGERVVTWKQGGRTCIVAGRSADVTALLRDRRS
jgi:hypothetical protein